MKRAAVAKITNAKGEILFLLRAKKPYGLCLPGGKIDAGETSEQACIREVFEETGIVLANDQLKFVKNVESYNGTPVAIFEVTLDHSPKILINPAEHHNERWLVLSEETLKTYHFAGKTLDWLLS